MRRILVASFAILLLVLGACGSPTEQDRDAARSRNNVERLIAGQPVEAGSYSPTREQIANWTRVWQSRPGVLAYTYLFVNGQPIGYYVLKGPPVSYAASATQSYHLECGSSNCVQMPNPGQDGAFYNQGSGQFQYYGTDATTNRELEFGGPTMAFLLSDKPLRINVPPLGDTVAPAAP